MIRRILKPYNEELKRELEKICSNGYDLILCFRPENKGTFKEFKKFNNYIELRESVLMLHRIERIKRENIKITMRKTE